MERKVSWSGCHRSARAVAEALPPSVVRHYEPDWVLADPVDGRAAEEARRLEARFPTLRPVARVATARESVARSGADDTVVMTMDTPHDMLAAIEDTRRSQAVMWQILGRGPGGAPGAPERRGPLVGFRGTIAPHDRTARRNSVAVLAPLIAMSRPTSSRTLTRDDPVTAAALAPVRQVLSWTTAQHLLERDRDPDDLTGSRFGIALGTRYYPAGVAEADAGDDWSSRQALALEIAGHRLPVRQLPQRVAVAVVARGRDRLEIFTVLVGAGDRRHADGVTVLAPVRAPQSARPAAALPAELGALALVGALFTD